MEAKMFEDRYSKRTMSFYILIWIFIVILIVMGFGVYKYFIKGETKMPFELSKIVIVSSAETTNESLTNNEYSAGIIQSNDIYVSITKNPKYKKEEFIKEISFDNFKIIGKNSVGTLEIYRPSKTIKKFDYKEAYKQQNIKYIGAQKTGLKDETLQIANQGGVMNFSIAFNNLGRISYPENENISLDGRLLGRLKLSDSDIKQKVSFDIKITVESGIIFYANIVLDLPIGDIIKDGIISLEYEGLQDIVFKRI